MHNLVYCFTLLAIAASFSTIKLDATWVSKMRHGDVVHFFRTAGTLERFDLVASEWLDSIDLEASPTAGWVDDDGIYVAFDKSVRRLNPDGTGSVHLRNFGYTVHGLFTNDHLLLVNYSAGLYSRIDSLEKFEGTLIDSRESYVNSSMGSSHAPGIRAIFGRSSGVSPSDIVKTTYDENGQISATSDSPHHGSFPNANRTWVFPNELRVVDNSGTIYSTSDLRYAASLSTGITDVAFHGDAMPVVLDGARVTGFGPGLLPTGFLQLGNAMEGIEIEDETIFLFASDATETTGIRVAPYALAELSMPEPGAPVDPLSVEMSVDDWFIDRDGILSLFSRAHLALFRWDLSAREWRTTVMLPVDPVHVAYDANGHSLFCATQTGLIHRLDLAVDAPQPEPFFNLPASPMPMVGRAKGVERRS